MKNNRTFIPLCLFLFISTASANETQNLAGNDQNNSDSQVITIETATIRGNQELPTVLYLVPWQPPVVDPLTENKPANLLEADIELIERESFQRLLQLHNR
ncbi:MAG: hypothetical protein ACMZ64_10225 [Oleiphilus sp.]